MRKGSLPIWIVHMKMETARMCMKIVYMKVEMETEQQIKHHFTLFTDITQTV